MRYSERHSGSRTASAKASTSLYTADVAYNMLLFLGSVAAYALTGWLTGMALVICFNLAARWKGGIDAGFISFRENRHPETSP